MLAVIVSALALGGCKTGSSIDRVGAQKVSDSFMEYLVADRVNDAVGEMEPEMFQWATHQQAEAGIRKVFDYCGRPLDSELKYDEVGFKVYLSGHKNPTRKFYYAAKTTQYPKGVCFFSVEVAPIPGGFGVTTFGPLKLQSGQLPP
ncbi:MAG: hypothetical protein WB683_06470 [Candidatus Sulfotelmatobacter sp.]